MIKVKISVPFKLGLLLSSITVVWGLPGQASGNADMSGNSNLGNHILDQLKCMAPPNPTLAFYALSKSKIINLKKNRGVDSVSCFDIRGGLKIGRLKFDFICGYSEDQLDWELFPNFYRRGPGTSPGPSISLGTHASLEKLKEWWRSQGLDGKPVFTKETSHLDYMDQDISEIICSNTN